MHIHAYKCTHWTLGNCVLQSPQYMNRSKILRGMQAGIRISYCCSMVRNQTSPQDIHEEMKTSDMIASSISWCLCWENLRWRGLYPTFDKYLPVGNPLLETQDKPVILTSFWKKSLSWHKYNSHNNNQLICKELQGSLAFDPQLMPVFRHAFSAPSLTQEQKFPQSQKKKKKVSPTSRQSCFNRNCEYRGWKWLLLPFPFNRDDTSQNRKDCHWCGKKENDFRPILSLSLIILTENLQ